MKTVKIHDKTFRLAIPESEIQEKVKAVAGLINRDYEGKCPLILAVLNGAFVFCADLVRQFTIPCEVSFVKLSSYTGTSSTGNVTEVIGINTDIKGRDVIIVEDIVESGLTMDGMIKLLGKYNVASVKVCSLFLKPAKLECDLKVDYPAMIIPDDFIVGYGLDYNEQGRELRDIYTLV